MLQTSMTGGISEALTSGLRTFLLREQGGLAASFKLMRSNIDACRRTHAEVEEAGKLQQEISGVCKAGQQMFNAAVHATRQRAKELAKRSADAEVKVREAEEKSRVISRKLERARSDREQALEHVRALNDALKTKRERLEVLKAGREIRRRLENSKLLLESARAVLAKSEDALTQARVEREGVRGRWEEAQRELGRAAIGLAEGHSRRSRSPATESCVCGRTRDSCSRGETYASTHRRSRQSVAK